VQSVPSPKAEPIKLWLAKIGYERRSLMDAVNKSFIAHARQDEQGHWLEAHFLEDHLRDVAKIAEALASSFGSENWGRLAGQWHDLGKYQNAFQDYIREKSGYEKENAHIEQGVNRVTH